MPTFSLSSPTRLRKLGRVALLVIAVDAIGWVVALALTPTVLGPILG